MANNKQTQAWSSEFGQEYTDRNLMTIEEMDAMYKKRYGTSRTDMNMEFLWDIDRNIKVLEVGSNVGLQLRFLQEMGFVNLYGIDISPYAVELSKSATKGISIIQGSALDVPFKDNYFDLVFTSGLLIHIPPSDIGMALDEIHRCAKRWIWGLEYYSPEYVQIKYREAKETSDLLWKADYPKLYCERFDDLKLAKVKTWKYLDSDNVDVMFLLEKRGEYVS